jgi:hypothetical protein
MDAEEPMTTTRASKLGAPRALASCLLLPIALCGCATIFSGSDDELSFSANVQGVRLSIDGKYIGELPRTVEMSRNFIGGKKFMARFEREGYQTQEFKLERSFNAVAILDISSPLTSGGIDVLTGAIMKFSPTDYQVQMLPAGQSAASSEFRRSVEGTEFALVNAPELQRDIVRGGGEYLSSFAWLLGNGEERAARIIEATALSSAAYLAGGTGPREFLRRFNHLLAETPALRAYLL